MADVDMYEASDYESDDFYDDDSDASFDEENVVVASKPKAAAKKTSASKKSVLAPSKNADNVPKAKASGKGGKGKKTIEEIYQKKSQLEHILLRPDTYIGSVESVTQPMFVLDEDTGRLVQRDVTFTPGLYKIFDEIIVNASDNKQRDPNMDKLEVVVDAEANQISVKNTGKGIPVEMHKEEKCYVPTLIFGHLLTGSNFNDDDKKTTGGRNGYGAKLANIFSHEFIVECVDTNNQLKFKQVFRDNMSIAEEPVIKSLTAKELKQGDYTKITFSPDLERFNMTSLDKDTVGLLSKRAYDIAGSMANRGGKKLAVTLNGEKVPVKSFKDYLNLLDGVNKPVAYEQIGDRWEVGVTVSEGSFQQVSFVNSISTSKGGSHVSYIADMIGASLVNVVKKKNKGGTAIKPNQVKNHLCVFVNALIENPTFDSQTKENLTSKKKDFGSKCELSEEFLKKVGKSDIVENILQFARFKERQALSRKNGVKKSKLTGIAKLDDANFAGTAKSKDCTLIITEGDSAKSLAMSGLSVVGRDYYGVFPLKGKPLNVRDATHTQMMKNEEIKNLLDIMGLKFNAVYDETSIKTLRYGHLMIMADQDHDGSHIKGLVINFIHKLWPSLLDIPGFLQQFITPIVKATKGKKSKTFFTLPEYDSWRESTGNDAKGWKIKYYKGLGTSTSAEAKEYFSNLDLHEVLFDTLSDDKVEAMEVDDESDDDMDFHGDKPASKETTGSDLIDMVFNKKRVDDRKAWLNTVEKDTYLDYSEARDNGVKYSDFINREFILFSQNDNQRSIPNVMDGFKPSQRKVLFACFKRKLKGEIKVAQLAGYIGEHSAYHHGEASLNEAIVGMAQNYVGSNNVNLLTPSGQFGTRRMGGKDHASVRYIFTTIEKVTRAIFHPDDDALLNYLTDDGLSIEPDFYMPVLPMILVNGSAGIGTGYSSSTPNYDPRAIIANIRHLIAGEEQEKLVPYYHGYKGEIVETKKGSYSVKGIIERTSDTSLLITELPLKKWTQDYKLFLEGMMDSKKGDPEIKDFQENHTDTTVSFVVNATKENIDAFEKEKNGLLGKFKLTTTLATSNMTLFDSEGRLVKYQSPEHILSSFFDMRLEYYDKRKELLLRKMRREQKMLSNKARFVEEVCAGELVVSNRKRTDILADLQERGYDILEKENDEQANDDDESGPEEDDTATDAELARGYEYLLGMKIWSLTYEKAQALREQLAEKTQEVADLEETPPSQLWLNDLDAVEEALDERDAAMDAEEQEQVKAVKKNKKHRAKKAAAKKSKKKKKGEWDSDISDSDDDDDAMDMSDSDDDVAPKKKAPAKKRTTVPKKPAAASKPKPKAVVKQAPVAAMPMAMEAEESDDEEVEMSLFDRLKKNNSGGASLKEASPAIQSDDEDSFGSLDASKFEAASLTPAVKKKKAATKRGRGTAAAASKKTAAAKKTTTAAKKPARRVAKKKIVEEDEFEFNSDSDDSDIQVVNASPVPARGRSGRNVKKISYSFSDSDDGDSDFE